MHGRDREFGTLSTLLNNARRETHAQPACWQPRCSKMPSGEFFVIGVRCLFRKYCVCGAHYTADRECTSCMQCTRRRNASMQSPHSGAPANVCCVLCCVRAGLCCAPEHPLRPLHSPPPRSAFWVKPFPSLACGLAFLFVCHLLQQRRTVRV